MRFLTSSPDAVKHNRLFPVRERPCAPCAGEKTTFQLGKVRSVRLHSGGWRPVSPRPVDQTLAIPRKRSGFKGQGAKRGSGPGREKKCAPRRARTSGASASGLFTAASVPGVLTLVHNFTRAKLCSRYRPGDRPTGHFPGPDRNAQDGMPDRAKARVFVLAPKS